MGKKIKKYTPIEHVKDRLKRAKDRVLARLFFGFGRKRRKKKQKENEEQRNTRIDGDTRLFLIFFSHVIILLKSTLFIEKKKKA